MRNQNYNNYIRLVPGYHFVLVPISLAALITAIIHVVISILRGESLLTPLLLLGLSVAVMMAVLFARIFACKAQDRAIRAEERLRHYLLAGKSMDPRITMEQIIALRFAEDEEFLALCERAMEEQMPPTAIKKAIRSWKADYDRV